MIAILKDAFKEISLTVGYFFIAVLAISWVVPDFMMKVADQRNYLTVLFVLMFVSFIVYRSRKK
ncbi:hypothetical protein [Eupransor demetentiae]|uniref:Uncharacterized protein n=1 Tax=Eupransor demetentiae TaxID=3109584 RepID=A0ABM9N570_9LACO|nr:hypothetical protein R54876_GBNLAHCA_00893 [Lactobacillaceae bacterium LMG 33000]